MVLTSGEDSVVNSKIIAWEKDLELDITKGNFLTYCQDIYVVTNIVKLRSFQYRLLMCAVITNVHLFHWKIKETNLCSFCNKAKEMPIHLFIMCDRVQQIWIDVEEYMLKYDDKPIRFDKNSVIFNRIAENPSNIKNFICLVVKQYVYAQRCLGLIPKTLGVIRHIKNQENIEKYIAVKNNKLHKHLTKWYPKSSATPKKQSEENVNIEEFVMTYVNNL